MRRSTARWSTANQNSRLELETFERQWIECRVGVCVKTIRECMDLQHMEHARDTAKWHMWWEVIEQTSRKKRSNVELKLPKRHSVREQASEKERNRKRMRKNRQTKSKNYRWEPIKYRRGARRRTTTTCTRTQLVDMSKIKQSMATKIGKNISINGK